MPGRGVLDWSMLLVSHSALVLAVALTATIAGLYLNAQPWQIPLLSAVLIAVGLRMLGTSTSWQVVIQAILLTILALSIAQLLFWSARLSGQIGTTVLEGMKRLNPDFLWVLTSISMSAGEWAKLALAPLLSAALCAWPWRRSGAGATKPVEHSGPG